MVKSAYFCTDDQSSQKLGIYENGRAVAKIVRNESGVKSVKRYPAWEQSYFCTGDYAGQLNERNFGLIMVLYKIISDMTRAVEHAFSL